MKTAGVPTHLDRDEHRLVQCFVDGLGCVIPLLYCYCEGFVGRAVAAADGEGGSARGVVPGQQALQQAGVLWVGG